jgi:hypothetical protein
LSHRGSPSRRPDGVGKIDEMRRFIMQARSTAIALLATLLAVSTVYGQGAIKIGDINSYKAMAANMASLSQRG